MGRDMAGNEVTASGERSGAYFVRGHRLVEPFESEFAHGRAGDFIADQQPCRVANENPARLALSLNPSGDVDLLSEIWDPHEPICP